MSSQPQGSYESPLFKEVSPKLNQINEGQVVLLPFSISSVLSPIDQKTTILTNCNKIQEYDQVFLTLLHPKVGRYFSQLERLTLGCRFLLLEK